MSLRHHTVGLTVLGLRTSATHVSRHRRHISQVIGDTLAGLDARPCRSPRRKPAWSSPPCSSTTRALLRSPPATAIHRAWVYKLKARYEAEGETALEPRSSRPKTSPPPCPRWWSTSSSGSARNCPMPAWTPAPRPSAGTCPPPRTPRCPVHDQPPPGRGRAGHPRAEEAPEVLLHPLRSLHAERDLAVRLHPLPAHPPDGRPGADVEIMSWLDDCTRYALHASAHPRITTPIVVTTFREALASTGSQHPRSPITAWSTPSDWPDTAARAATTPSSQLRRRHIVQKNSDPTTRPPAARPNGSSRR